MKMKYDWKSIGWVLPLAVVLVACGGKEPQSSPTVTPEPTPVQQAAVPTATPALALPTIAPADSTSLQAGTASDTPVAAAPEEDELLKLTQELDKELKKTETGYDLAGLETAVKTPKSLGDLIIESKPATPTPSPTPYEPQGVKQILSTTPAQSGTASIGILEAYAKGPSGSLARAMPNDYVLTNGKVTLTFVRVEPVKPGEVIQVRQDLRYMRRQGALIDVTLGGSPVDFIGEFTQAVGASHRGRIFEYDSAEFLTRAPEGGRPGAAGLRLTGSSLDGLKDIRIETTYWLAEGETRAEVTTRIVGGEESTVIADYTDWGPCMIYMETNGPATKKTELSTEVPWYVGSTSRQSMGIGNAGGPLKGVFRAQFSRLAAPSKDGVQTRWLYFAEDNASAVNDQIYADTGVPTGIFRGRVVHKETQEPAPGAWVNVYWQKRPDTSDPEAVAGAKFNPVLLTRANVRSDGSYQATLPSDLLGNEGRYFVGTGDRARGGGMSNEGIVIKSGAITERELYVSLPARLTVKVIDSKTSQPIAARVRFDPVPPTQRSDFMEIASPKGYLNYFYVTDKGSSIDINQGVYTLTATAGIRYDTAKVDVQTVWGQETEAEIVINESSPSPGFVAMDIGAMTNATPGCSLTAEERLMMTVGEGLNWIISGDLDVITDFEPVIKQAGLEGKVRSSRGFRTYLPAHPEWGEFLVYPLPADAKDPREVKSEWKGLAKAKDFLAKLRELYPGAWIGVANPYSDPAGTRDKSEGYFQEPGWNLYQMAYDDEKRSTEIDFGVDSVGLFANMQRAYNFQWEKDFLFVNMMRDRTYVPAPISTGRTALGGEPGYPRLLVKVAGGDVAKADEQELLAQMKKGAWQLTSGPFADVSADGRREGDMYKPENNANMEVKIHAPNWAPTTNIDINKDFIMNSRDADLTDANRNPLRFDHKEEVTISPETKNFDDTILNAAAWTDKTVPEVLPPAYTFQVPIFTLSGPIFIDSNGNKVYDKVEIYRDKGK